MLLYLLFFIRFWNTVEHHYSHCPNNMAASDSFSSTLELQNKKLMTPPFSQFKSSLVTSHLPQFPLLFQKRKNTPWNTYLAPERSFIARLNCID